MLDHPASSCAICACLGIPLQCLTEAVSCLQKSDGSWYCLCEILSRVANLLQAANKPPHSPAASQTCANLSPHQTEASPDLAPGGHAAGLATPLLLGKQPHRRDSEMSHVSSVGSVDAELAQHNQLFEVLLYSYICSHCSKQCRDAVLSARSSACNEYHANACETAIFEPALLLCCPCSSRHTVEY